MTEAAADSMLRMGNLIEVNECPITPRVMPPGTAPMDDAHPLARGDQAAFDEVYRTYAPQVTRLLSRGFSYNAGGRRGFARVKSGFDVEDLTQEAFSAFFRQCMDGVFDPSRSIRPYLFRIAINLALRRMNKASREVLLDGVEAPAQPVPDAIETKETAALVAQFKSELSEREQAVLKEYFEDEEGSQNEVGARLGLSRDQVARAIGSIRKKSLSFFRKNGWRHDA